MIQDSSDSSGTNANGELELAAIHVSLWSGFQYVGQIVFQAISPFISDRFGRRIAMFVLLLLMLTVSGSQS
jgi:MFS family permease